ncbi:cobyric acid synthase [Paludibaculum fermentans]|uniref:CobQ/CobB/MinD/ParA nucleotide binding domain-containing protein n=1 Tax=Paludibaculum fermentans TaxID=1473598 RepID=A0A7S7NUY9_PALFE|nr:hypothetical protein [Paludibaculum fermentans]QOY90282.1 hypothetical protein IRI77_10095 [Paludibaculum fermentans]
MPAQVIAITSRLPGAGKTHVAAALAAWLKREGRHVAPLHLSRPEGDPFQCPEGGTVSRATALLAEACGLPAEPIYESGWPALPALLARHDVIVAELAAGDSAPAGYTVLELPVSLRDGFIQLGELPPLAPFEPNLTPQCPEDVAALPLWSLISAPRSGIISVPHLANFADFQLIRGAEWLTVQAPGRFQLLFVPASLEPAKDLEWIREASLDTWIAAQHASGTRLISTGWPYPGAEQLATGALKDNWTLSRILGRRVPPPLPTEESLDRLGHWLSEAPGVAKFVHQSV